MDGFVFPFPGRAIHLSRWADPDARADAALVAEVIETASVLVRPLSIDLLAAVLEGGDDDEHETARAAYQMVATSLVEAGMAEPAWGGSRVETVGSIEPAMVGAWLRSRLDDSAAGGGRAVWREILVHRTEALLPFAPASDMVELEDGGGVVEGAVVRRDGGPWASVTGGPADRSPITLAAVRAVGAIDLTIAVHWSCWWDAARDQPSPELAAVARALADRGWST